MADDRQLALYIQRLTRALRQWCRGEAMPATEEAWLTAELVRLALRDPILRARLQAAARAQGARDAAAMAASHLGEIICRDPNRLAELLRDVIDADDAILAAAARRRVNMRMGNLLYHHWKDSDPIGASIDRSLWDELSNHPDIHVLLPDLSAAPRFVTASRDGNLRMERPAITRDEMVDLISQHWRRTTSLPRCVRTIIGIVAGDDQWCALIPIGDVLFDALCEAARAGVMRVEELRFAPTEMSPDVRLVFDAARAAAITAARETISRYIADGKMTPAIGAAMLNAAEAILRDFGLSGDLPVEHGAYFLSCCPEVDHEEFVAHYRSKFQYVMRLTMESLVGEFRSRWGK